MRFDRNGIYFGELWRELPFIGDSWSRFKCSLSSIDAHNVYNNGMFYDALTR